MRWPETAASGVLLLVADNYDAASNRSSIYQGGTRRVACGYDHDERLASVTGWNSP
jgi:hypothetical protein